MKNKKLIRKKFRKAVFTRDNYTCVMCGVKPDSEDDIDPHHIENRNLLPNGGYVLENGITLCSKCHVAAEVYHSTGIALEGWHPDDLYKKIHSSKEEAIKASNELND